MLKAVAMNDERIYESLPKRPNTPLTALTGGFRTCSAINSALASGHVDLIGIGHASGFGAIPRSLWRVPSLFSSLGLGCLISNFEWDGPIHIILVPLRYFRCDCMNRKAKEITNLLINRNILENLGERR